MGSVDCSYTLARQLQIHLDAEKKPFMTPWKWFSNFGRSKRRDRDSSVLLISNNGLTPGSPRFPVDVELHQTKLIDSDLSPVIPLPNGIDLNEWLATQTIFLFDCINMLFGCLFEFCTASSCPTMSGPANIIYHWPDDRGKKAKLSAPRYIDCVTSYASSCIKEEAIFPTKYGNPLRIFISKPLEPLLLLSRKFIYQDLAASPRTFSYFSLGNTFPPTFPHTVKNIHRLLCHVLVHIQHAHADHLKALDLSAHYTTTLQHFILFNKHFSLANEADLGLFDSIYELLNAPAVVPVIADFSSPSELPLGSFDSEVGESPELQNTASPTQTVSMKPDEIREDAKSDSIVVDKYVPVFTIVT